jgi:hypothetical protein
VPHAEDGLLPLAANPEVAPVEQIVDAVLPGVIGYSCDGPTIS